VCWKCAFLTPRRGRVGAHAPTLWMCRDTMDVQDTSHALLRLAGGAVGVTSNSWVPRIRRGDTMVMQMDGSLGSAVASHFCCFTHAVVNTPEAFQ
jgi:hypothetical protein